MGRPHFIRIIFPLEQFMNKIMAIDPGDAWVGVALSDASGMLARPYKTIGVKDLEKFITTDAKQIPVDTIIIGYPKTMRGTESLQTKKILDLKVILEKKFPEITFILWDERLSSKRAEQSIKIKTKEDKLKIHALAAAYILDSYLLFRSAQNIDSDNS